MRVLGKVVLAVGVAALLGSPALAQRGGGGGFGGGGLLMTPGVQKELKLTDEQKQKVETALKEFREKHADDYSKLRDLEPKEQMEAFQKLTHESREAVTPILDKEQAKRFKEIDRQVRGVQAFADHDVQKHLKLTDKQKEEIKTIQEDSVKQMREIFTNAQGDAQGAREKFTALRKDSLEKVTKILTDDQKKTWKEMTGKHFEFQRGAGRRRGNG